MLGIQSQPQVQAKTAVSFKGDDYYTERYHGSGMDYDSFDRDSIESERDDKMSQVDDAKRGLEDFADQLDTVDNKVAKKASKFVRLGAAVIGLGSVFLATKYSSKLGIETLKTTANNPAIKNTLDAMKKPLKSAFDGVSKFATKLLKNRKVLRAIVKVKNSPVGKAVMKFLKNPTVAKVLEPIKNTFKAMRGVQLSGAKIQSAVENTLGGTAVMFKAVDDMTGRNNDKSTVELATGM